MQPREPRCCTLPWRQVSFSKAWRCFMARKCCKTSRASGRCAPPSLGPAAARRAIHHHPRPGRRGAFRPNAPGKMQIERRVSLFRFRNFLYKFYKQVQVKGAFPCPPAAPASAERGNGWETQGQADVCVQLSTMAVVVPFTYHSPLGLRRRRRTAPVCALLAVRDTNGAVVRLHRRLHFKLPVDLPAVFIAVRAIERCSISAVCQMPKRLRVRHGSSARA